MSSAWGTSLRGGEKLKRSFVTSAWTAENGREVTGSRGFIKIGGREVEKSDRISSRPCEKARPKILSELRNGAVRARE